MPVINHPAAEAERTHLNDTQRIIAAERAVAVQEQKNAEGELSYARMMDPDALPLREMLYASAIQTVRNMDLAAMKPYFTRVDFHEQGADLQKYYIGKYGLLNSDTLSVEVVDWRAPVANLYYSGQIGPVNYVAPDGTVEGELVLKRQFGIEDGELQTIFDTDLVSQDKYLQSVLSATTGDRLREIVTTIQAEQNFVIRYPLNRSLIVQGVAGSGKTTIALHRIAYLLYTYQDRLKAHNMMILAPNPLFLNFIAGVLPDLGVESVQQTTFSRLLSERFDDRLPACAPRMKTQTLIKAPPEVFSGIERRAQARGSLEMEAWIDRWFARFEKSFSPKAGFSFGPVRLFTHEQIEQFLLVDEKPFPMARRLSEFKKQLKVRTKAAERTIIRFFTDEFDRRAARLNQTIPNMKERQQRLDTLRESFEKQVADVKAQVRPYINDAMKAFPPLDMLSLYQDFWRFVQDAPDSGEDMRLAAEVSLAGGKKGIESEDMAALALIALKVLEIPKLDIRHIVIDEAQDFSPLEFMLLKRMFPFASMTVVGDLMQGVSAWRGLKAWEVLSDGVFGGAAAMHYLVTSYRNTIEIMNTAIRVAVRRPTPNQQVAKPVLRHGDEPEFICVQNEKARMAGIEALARKLRTENMTSVAIIAKSPGDLPKIQKALPADLSARILNVDAESFEAGLLIASADAVKGLEFDAVIMADVSGDSYKDNDLDARLLYVCLTRALHKLTCFYLGEMSPLLQ